MSGKRAKFDAAPMPAVTTEGVRAIPTGGGFAERLMEWAESSGVLGVYANVDTGWRDIVVNKQSVREVNYHYARAGKLAVFQVIGELIRNGVYLETTRRNRQLVSHVFAGKITIDGTAYAVAFSINEDMNGKRYYNHELMEMEMNRLPPRSWPGRQAAAGDSAKREPIGSIVRRHLFVKP